MGGASGTAVGELVDARARRALPGPTMPMAYGAAAKAWICAGVSAVTYNRTLSIAPAK